MKFYRDDRVITNNYVATASKIITLAGIESKICQSSTQAFGQQEPYSE